MPETKQAGQREISRAIEEWLLSTLRFAITLDERDRAVVLALGAEMDRRGSGFTFFTRTSVKVCEAVVSRDRGEAVAALRTFVGAIDHLPLRRAFEALLDIRKPGADRRAISARNREKLWQGLPIRGARTVSWR